MSDPILQPTPLVCGSCQHEWRAKLLGWVTVKVWIEYVKSLRCPECGAGYKKIAIRLKKEQGQ